MAEAGQKPDDFQRPSLFVSPSIQNIFKDENYLEDSISYSFFKRIPPTERLIPDRPTRHVQFRFRDLNAFLNPAKCYIVLKFYAEKSDGTALDRADFTSAMNPLSHSLIETFSLNIGECEIFRVDRLYFLMAKLYFLNNVSEQSKKTFRSFFEGYEPENDTILQNDISLCFNTDENGNITTPKTSQGKICDSLTGKKEHFFIFQLNSPLESFQSLLLPDLDFGNQTLYLILLLSAPLVY